MKLLCQDNFSRCCCVLAKRKCSVNCKCFDKAFITEDGNHSICCQNFSALEPANPVHNNRNKKRQNEIDRINSLKETLLKRMKFPLEGVPVISIPSVQVSNSF
jgi:hypothetical protein